MYVFTTPSMPEPFQLRNVRSITGQSLLSKQVEVLHKHGQSMGRRS